MSTDIVRSLLSEGSAVIRATCRERLATAHRLLESGIDLQSEQHIAQQEKENDSTPYENTSRKEYLSRIKNEFIAACVKRDVLQQIKGNRQLEDATADSKALEVLAGQAKQEVQGLRQENEGLRADILELASGLAGSLHELEEEERQLREEIAQLESDLVDSPGEAEVGRLSESARSSESRRQALEAERDELRARCDAACNDMLAAEEEALALREELARLASARAGGLRGREAGDAVIAESPALRDAYEWYSSVIGTLESLTGVAVESYDVGASRLVVRVADHMLACTFRPGLDEVEALEIEPSDVATGEIFHHQLPVIISRLRRRLADRACDPMLL